jgi:hypothetical protein
MQESAMQAPTAMAAQAMQAPTAMQEPTAMAAIPAAPAMQEPAQPTAMAAAPAGPVALHTGSLIPGSFPGDRAEGNVTIYRLEDGKQVLRLEDFKTTNGPDLFVVLSAHADPDKADVKSADYTQLAALKGNQGNQNYELPADIDLGKYQSVVIWCRTFNIVFGYATLQPAAS